MEKFMEFVNGIWQYLLANPVLLYVCAGVLGLIVITVIALCIKKGSQKRKAKKAAKKAAAEKAAQEAKAAEEKKAAEKAQAAEAARAASRARAEAIAREMEEEEKQSPATVVVEKTAEKKTTTKKPAQKKSTAKKEPKTEKTVKAAEPVKVEEPKIEPIKEEPVPTVQEENKPSKRYSGKWVLYRLLVVDDNGDTVEETFYFELHASNGEKLLSSEEYTTLAGAAKGIETHKANIARDNFRITTSKKGEFIFKLLSGKNTLLCTGENYPTKLRCEKAIESTKRFSETAYVDETMRDVYVKLPVEEEEETVEKYDESYVGKWIISAKREPDTEETFYFELFASNGEKLLTSEEYTSYVGAINGINTHKANIEKDNFRIALTKRGDYIFKLLSSNGQLLCLGEHYKTKRRCESAVESVKRFAKNAPILKDAQIIE